MIHSIFLILGLFFVLGGALPSKTTDQRIVDIKVMLIGFVCLYLSSQVSST